MRLSKLIQEVRHTVFYKNEDWEREIASLSMDSRKKSPSSLFFCLSGKNVDGHEFASEAILNGAVAVITERVLPVSVPQIVVADGREALGRIASEFYGNPSKELSVIGVTGPNGKTTTTYMLQSIFHEHDVKTGVIGTLGATYEGKNHLPSLTTPDPVELQETLAKMRDSGVEYVFMEVSAHALYYKKTAGVRFKACIFTNLSQDHLDFFENMQEYEKAKLLLFNENCPLAVINGDDPTGRKIGTLRSKRELSNVLYGLTEPADAFAIITDERLLGTECMLNVDDGLCRISLSMSGRHNVYNALASATCAVKLGVSLNTVARGLSKLTGVAGRLQRIARYRGGEIFVDFAHTPDGLAKSLDGLKAHCKGRLLCLFGCGGNRDCTKRALMGEIAAKRSDFCVLTSDNPRYEDPLDIISAIEGGYRRFSTRYVIVPDRERAIEYALAYLREGDVLLIAGKGGETYQEIMGIKYEFNDQAIVEKILSRKGNNGQ